MRGYVHRSLLLKITTTQLTPEFREKLVKTIKENKGTIPLTMTLHDPEKQWNIDFLSRKFNIAVTAPFIEELSRMQVAYSVLKK